MRRRILMFSALVVAALAGATPAASAGGPSPGISQGWNGLVRGDMRYVTVPAGSMTSLQAIRLRGGRVVAHMVLAGSWGIPQVAFDGTTEGFLPDGRTLVLAQQVFVGDTLRKTTTFTLVDVRKMKVVDTIKIPGAFAFDALSPDGRYLYLVEYMESTSGEYRVRAFDMNQTKLLAKIVTDRKTWETGMSGSPVARTWTGGWAYTLYGANSRPFIHALNTRGVAADCIFLPWKTSPEDIFQYRLRNDGKGHVVVRGPRGRALVVIDSKTRRIISAVRNP
jgi:hypothetical protein